jgi:hypothetical protein
MKREYVFKAMGRRVFLLALLAILLFTSAPAQARRSGADGGASEAYGDFREIAHQGFGDRQNTKAWSMIWWKGKLYVGTARAHFCVELWGLADAIGWPFVYPPEDPDMECTEDPKDLPLRAEIWRYTPETDIWDRVFQSPEIQNPDSPDKDTARDSGFRGIAAFTDPDGTEVLYIGGITSEAMNPGMPPPRILRSTDGENWEPIPQDPGSVLGDLERGQANFRGMEVYKERLYVVNGGMRGGGSVLEAENPAGGNDNFRWVTPDEVRVYEMAIYNGYLYLGTQATLDEPNAGYAVMKTDATGSPPYTYTVVVDEGAYLSPLPSNAVVSMYVYKDRLYIGTDKPAEMIRINPDDTWDLIVGAPRDTPEGWKEPLSGMGSGFDWLLNEHIWRMCEHEGNLYVGTNDATGFGKDLIWMQPFLEAMGYDLFVSPNGVDYTMLTRTGFYKEGLCDDQLGIGIRVFASTPYGLFFGTSNPFYGLRIFLGEAEHRLYLPLIQASRRAAAIRSPALGVSGEWKHSARRLSAPQHVGLENHGGGAVLFWEPVPNAVRYRLFRSDFVPAQELGILTGEPDLRIPRPFREMGITDQPFFVDGTTQGDRVYHYYVQAEGSNGLLSSPSNLARAPSLNTPTTASGLRQVVANWTPQHQGEVHGEGEDVIALLSSVQERLEAGDLGGALVQLEQLQVQARLKHLPQLSWWRAEDFDLLLGRLIRRIRLAQAGIISPLDLR